MLFKLQPHPESTSHKVREVSVEIRPNEAGWWFMSYDVEPAGNLMIPNHPPARLDRLWVSTCFELFIKVHGGGYREFNFAPAGGWNAYSFSDWRRGMTPIELKRGPNLVDARLDDRRVDLPNVYSLDVVLEPDMIANGTRISLTAVIEETSGNKSYWALAHPPGPPNFHHAACFTERLPLAAEESSPRA